MKDEKLYFQDHYRTEALVIEIKKAIDRCKNPLCHGGTLWALIKDFTHYILTGAYSNHRHGYGGLYCPHWGYEKESMKAIRKKARDLGYLATDEEEDNVLSRKAMNGEI